MSDQTIDNFDVQAEVIFQSVYLCSFGFGDPVIIIIIIIIISMQLLHKCSCFVYILLTASLLLEDHAMIKVLAQCFAESQMWLDRSECDSDDEAVQVHSQHLYIAQVK